MRRSYIFWGIILVSFGSIFILDGINPLPGNPFDYLWQVFLIILGVWILLNVLWRTKGEKTEYLTIPLQGATRAKIRINHGAGSLNINSGTKDGELLTCSSMGTVQQYSSLVNGILEVRLSPGADIVPLVGLGEGFNWDLQLINRIPLSLILETGASQTYANLSDLNIPDLKLSTGASTTTIVLSSIAESSNVSINAGVASMNIQVPENVSARIRVKDGLTSLSINKDRFPRVDANTYQSQDYSYGIKRTEIKIEAGLGSITIQ
jgi:hypothetical protein